MRPRPSMYRGPVVLLVFCLVLLLAGSPTWAAPGDSPIPPRSTPTETGKYYVVGPPTDGQREFLYAIAVKTLGDGGRYREILVLNQGRPQPDGGRLTDATTVEPGWILILPADAAGPDVLTGPLPVSAGSPRGTDRPAVAAGGSADWASTGLRVTLVVLAVLLVIWARVALLGRGRARPARTTDPQPDVGAGGGPETESDSDAVAEASAGPGTGTATAASRVGRTVLVRRPAPAPAPIPDLGLAAVLASRASNPFATLTAALDCGGRPVRVRLVGARPARWGSAYGWLPAGRRPPPSTAALILGERDGLRLWADLGRAPDALTIVGDPPAAERHAATLVAQLGVETTVVVAGDALGDDLPDGARWIPEVADLDSDGSTGRMNVVVCSAADAAALRGPLRRLASDGRRTVPVIVGLAPAARWSIRIGGTGAPRPPADGSRSDAS